ncbi:MAG TPA: hypothetical protein VGM87_05925 [Roseomonas sp.]|jgi:hypothetical protein
MSEFTSDAETADRAAALAREFAPELGAVLFTHYPDADTLDMLRPGGAGFHTIAAANKAAAAALAALGVQVFVQVADRAAFRRWMDGRADTADNRLAWRDRERLLRGPAALEALGVDPKLARPRPKPGKGSGTPADRLVRAFAEEGDPDFEDLALELIEGGRDGVLEVATRKVADRYGEDAVADFTADLLLFAEAADIGPAGWAELVALPVALPPGALPDAAALGLSLIGSGVLPETLEVRFLPAWRAPQALAALSPIALRRVLVQMVAGQDPADLPPAAPDSLAEDSFGVLLGLQIDWQIPLWEEIAANGLPEEPEDDGEDDTTPEEDERATLFDRWRSAVFESGDGCVPLALVSASEVDAEIAAFLEEAREQAGGLEEIREFVAVARQEAAGEEVVCRLEILGDGLELSLYTRQGRFLDSLTLGADQLPVKPEEMPRLIEAFVPIVKDTPGV